MRIRPLVATGAVLVALAVSGCDPRTSAITPLAHPATPAVPAPAAPAAPTQKAQLLELVNAERRQAGLAPLALHDGVADVARSWAAQLAREGALRHRPDLTDALGRAGVTDWSTAGENVGYGPDVREVHGRFMGSASHRRNVLDARFTHVGIGVTAADGRVWVTVDLVGY